MLVKKIIFVLFVAGVFTALDAKKGERKGRGHNRRSERRGGGRRNEARKADIVYIPPISGQKIRFGGNVSRTFASGNIEVYVRNKWGPICDDEWNNIDANVACRQLGFLRGADHFTVESKFGVGQWQASDILMDDIKCHGNENNVLSCSYELTSNCGSTEFAGVSCLDNTGCPDGWLAGPTGCYYLSNITTTQKKFAVNKCAALGGHLVNIETEAENHFLSAVFANIPGEPIVTGATKNRNHWMWEKVMRSSTRNRHRRAPKGGRSAQRRSGRRGSSRSSSSYTESTQRVSVRFFKWFPGWLPGNKNSQPNGKKGDACLYLLSAFPHPDKSLGDKEMNYLFWDDNVCSRKKKKMKNGFRYLCEKQKTAVEESVGETRPNPKESCYHGDGSSYRGSHANTERGTPCIKWSDSRKHTPEKFPNKGLEGHNYCRNPDDDVRPWCYVNNEGKFGFCRIPKCSDGNITTTMAPVYTTTTAAPDCPDGKFFCARSSKCIGQQWHCDYEPDCAFDEDETNCDYKIHQFDMINHRKLSEGLVRETYIGTSNETCAKFCLDRKTYVCRSFSFFPIERKCELSDENRQTAILPYIWGYKSYVYELMSQTTSCDGMFSCGNGKCVAESVVCNQVDDCGDSSDEQQCGGTDTAVEVRLVDGDEQSGRVEVKYLGEWGVICDDEWDNNDAAVVCNMLGYSRVSAIAISHSKFGSGNGNFFLDEVHCIGIEDSITNCTHRGWKVHDCQTHEVAGVSCKAQKACTSSQYSCSNGQCVEASSVCDGTCQCLPGCEDEKGDGIHDCSSASLVIVDGPRTGSGRVEIVRNGLRGTVCDDSWDDKDATVVCKMAGYNYGTAVTGGGFGPGTGAVWLDDVECTGTEVSLINCRMSGWGVTNCDHSEDAGVICSNDPPVTDTPPVDSPTVEVVLVDGDSATSGRVEVIHDGVRGTICDDAWDDNDATIVCNMLGYSFGVAKIEGYYGPGSSHLPILLDDVECDGTESSIAQCIHSGWGSSNCGHGEDAGVECYMGEEEGGQIETDNSDELSSFTCGLRPLESVSRKRREDPGYDENREVKELAPPPKFERIFGGFTAAKGFYPWQVGIRRYIQNGIYSHWCGGTILSPNWILSAAHCFSDIPKGLIVVRTGDHDNKVDDEHEQEFELEQLINHQFYNEENFNNDIALLKVSPLQGSGIKFNDHVQPACLPDITEDYVAGQKCHVSGWGKTEHGYQNLLKSARVPIVEDATCRRIYKDVTDKMFCAGYMAGGIDTCSGDSGGPLVCEINGRYTVMGATSWGAQCAKANAPGVYAKVTEFIPWIKSTIKQYS